MKNTHQDVAERLDTFLAEFIAAGEDLHSSHEFVANFVGEDEVLRPMHKALVDLGFRGDPPNSGGWIYMHIERPLNRKCVLQLSAALEGLASENGCLFELLDVTVAQPNKFGQLVVLGATDA